MPAPSFLSMILQILLDLRTLRSDAPLRGSADSPLESTGPEPLAGGVLGLP